MRKGNSRGAKGSKIALAALLLASTIGSVIVAPELAHGKISADGFSYSEVGSGIRILNYGGTATAINIPHSMDGLPVKHVTISATGVTSIDASQATEMTFLNAANNALTQLSLGSNTNLKSLYVEGNKLTSLNLTGVSSLTTLTTYGNPFDMATRYALPAFANASVSDSIPPVVTIAGDITTLSQQEKVKVVITDNYEVGGVSYAWSASPATPSTWTPYGDTALKAQGTERIEISAPASSGTMYLHVQATDIRGNVTNAVSSRAFTITREVDVAFSPNGNGSYKKQQDAVITYPADASVTLVTYGWSNSPVVAPVNYTAITSGTRATAPSATGAHYLWVEKVISGRVTKQVSSPFLVDGTAPTVTVTVDAIPITNGQLRVNVQAYDAHSGLAETKYASGSQTAAYFATGGTALVGGGFTAPENGRYTVYAKDRVGNETVDEIIVTALGTAPPLLDVAFSSTTPTKNPITVTVSPKNRTLGASVIRYLEGDRTLSEVRASGRDITNSPTIVANNNGAYTFYLKDLMGNENKQVVLVTMVDKVKPTVNLSKNGDSIYAATHTTRLTVTDNLTIGKILYGWSTSKTVAPTQYREVANNTILATPTVGEMYYLWVKATDSAGWETQFISEGFNTNKDDLGGAPACDGGLGSKCDAVLLTEGNVTTLKATVTGAKTAIRVQAKGMSYTIPVERTATKWDVSVSYDSTKGKNTVVIKVYADGNAVTRWAKPMLIDIGEKAYKYVGRETGVSTGLFATPHRLYAGEGMHFKAFTTEHTYKLHNNAKSFTDTKSNFANAEISELASRGIVNGTSSTKYEPEARITRGQFSAILGRSLGQLSSKKAPFTDISGNTFEEEINLLSGLGIVNGITATKFDVNAEITREQAATILARTLKHLGYTAIPATQTKFTDAAKVSTYAQEGVRQLSALGIINGFPNGEFKPQEKVTRSQMARMLWVLAEVTELY